MQKLRIAISDDQPATVRIFQDWRRMKDLLHFNVLTTETDGVDLVT